MSGLAKKISIGFAIFGVILLLYAMAWVIVGSINARESVRLIRAIYAESAAGCTVEGIPSLNEVSPEVAQIFIERCREFGAPESWMLAENSDRYGTWYVAEYKVTSIRNGNTYNEIWSTLGGSIYDYYLSEAKD